MVAKDNVLLNIKSKYSFSLLFEFSSLTYMAINSTVSFVFHDLKVDNLQMTHSI